MFGLICLLLMITFLDDFCELFIARYRDAIVEARQPPAARQGTVVIIMCYIRLIIITSFFPTVWFNFFQGPFKKPGSNRFILPHPTIPNSLHLVEMNERKKEKKTIILIAYKTHMCSE